MVVDLLRDQREDPLGVGFPADQLAVLRAQSRFELVEAVHDAVVGKDPPVLGERVRVALEVLPVGREADVRDELA